MLEFYKPLPVVTPLGDGYAIYVTDGGMFENDCFTVVLCDGGQVRHFTSEQIQIFFNATYNINKKTDGASSS